MSKRTIKSINKSVTTLLLAFVIAPSQTTMASLTHPSMPKFTMMDEMGYGMLKVR